MTTEITMPQWSMGMSEGTIAAWYKQPGDAVALDEPLAEIEAEKVTQDLLSTAAGTLAEIVVPAGATVPVRTVLAIVS